MPNAMSRGDDADREVGACIRHQVTPDMIELQNSDVIPGPHADDRSERTFQRPSTHFRINFFIRYFSVGGIHRRRKGRRTTQGNEAAHALIAKVEPSPYQKAKVDSKEDGAEERVLQADFAGDRSAQKASQENRSYDRRAGNRI